MNRRFIGLSWVSFVVAMLAWLQFSGCVSTPDTDKDCGMPAPEAASNPVPANYAINQPDAVTLAWTASTVSCGESVTYDVHFGTSSNPTDMVVVGEARADTTLLQAGLSPAVTYYWKVVAKANGHSTDSEVWSFTTGACTEAPTAPTNPDPADGATDQPTSLTLSWAASTVTCGGPVTYDLYIGLSSNPPLVRTGLTNPSQLVSDLEQGARYYWKVVAKANGQSMGGEMWTFWTGPCTVAPTAPTNPSPADGATDLPRSLTLSWAASTVTCGGPVTYDLYIGLSSDPPLVRTGLTNPSQFVSDLEQGALYYWKVVAKANGQSTGGEMWTFTTVCTAAATAPTNPSPADGATDLPRSLTLSWAASTVTCGGPVTYDLYIGLSSDPPLVRTGLTNPSQFVSDLEQGALYYWKVVAKANGQSTGGEMWTFTTVCTAAATAPTNPSPAHNATNQPTSLTLSWAASTVTCGGPVTYDLYIGLSSDPPLVRTGLTSPSQFVSDLEQGALYYWKVVAKANGQSTIGDVWSFATLTIIEKVATPTFSPPAGTYGPDLTVTISCATSGATIRYTTNGSEPTTSSPTYSSAISVTSTMTLKAKAWKTGWTTSDTGTAAYTIIEKVATPTFSPSGGTYNSSQTVIINCATSGATIRYTTNGSEPTTSSPSYTSPITVSTTMTLKAKAWKTGWTTSDTGTAAYTIIDKVATPTFSPPPGTYGPDLTVTISCATSGATIRYTTNGSEPTTSSPAYTSPIAPSSGSMTFKAKAWKTGWTPSDTATAAYTIIDKVATPTFSPSGGEYSSSQSVAISCATSGATIRYTTNGSEPTTSSPTYTSPITVSTTMTLKAKAWKTGWTTSDTGTAAYTIIDKVATPTFSPSGGEYSSSQSVAISCATSGATIRYTTNGSEPSTSSPAYTSPITVSTTMTLKAKAWKTGWTTSDTGTAAYTIIEKVATPTFSPSGGEYSSSQSVAISCATSGATIRYTTNGGEPSTSSPAYTSPITVSTTMTLKAKAWKTGWTTSDTGTAAFTIIDKVATPTFSPSGGEYSSSQSVAISCATSGATIRYTTNGSEPTTSSPTYTSPITVSTTMTLKAKAWKTGWTTSDTGTAAYTIIEKVATPTFSPSGGTYNSSQTVIINCATSGATIRYTTNGSEPTTSSPAYTSPITVSTTMTLKAKAWKTGWTTSDTGTAAYTIIEKVATPTFSPSGGEYSSSQSVAISCATSGATIRYTTNGSEPTTSSPAYTSPITVSTTMTLKAKAWKTGWTTSDTGTAAYTITGPVATPTCDPIGGTYTSSRSVTITCATSGVTIRYTTNGSEPTTSSPVYTSPITVSTTMTLKAKAWKTGWTPSATRTEVYTIMAAAYFEFWPTSSSLWTYDTNIPSTYLSSVSLSLDRTTLAYDTTCASPRSYVFSADPVTGIIGQDAEFWVNDLHIASSVSSVAVRVEIERSNYLNQLVQIDRGASDQDACSGGLTEMGPPPCTSFTATICGNQMIDDHPVIKIGSRPADNTVNTDINKYTRVRLTFNGWLVSTDAIMSTSQQIIVVDREN
jgi:N-acetyl-beta-hexosaminidase